MKDAISLFLNSLPNRPEQAMTIDKWMDYVDRVEMNLIGFPLEDCETKHRFFPGLYVRECRMTKGSMVISRIHNTEHPFVILEGKIRVRTHEGVRIFEAPYFGRTMPMTRRILFAHTDNRWMTFHPTQLTDVEEIMKEILHPRVNPLLSQSQLLRLDGFVKETNQV